MQTRLQNFDDDSDDAEYEPKMSIRQASNRTASRMMKSIDVLERAEDSHDENDSCLPTGNLLNADLDNLQTNKTDMKSDVRGGLARRVNTKSAAASSTDANPVRGFVPRDLSTKVRRNNSTNVKSRDVDDDRNFDRDENDEKNSSEPAPWTKVPKKFLSDPVPSEVAASTNSRFETSKLPQPSKGWNESQISSTNRSSDDNGRESKTFSKPSAKPMYRRPKEQDFEAADSSDEEQDSKSVESSNTVEDFDAAPTVKLDRTTSNSRKQVGTRAGSDKGKGISRSNAARQPPGKRQERLLQEPRNDEQRYHQAHQQQQPGSKQGGRATPQEHQKELYEQDDDKEGEEEEEEEDFEIEGGSEADDFDPTVMKDGEYYTDYVARSKALAATSASASETRPNKSGRYADENAEEATSSNNAWATDSTRGDGSGGGGKTSWASVRPPPNVGPGTGGASEYSPTSSRFSFVLVAHARGVRTEHVQCTVIRDRKTSINGKLHPSYELILEETNKPILRAQKMKMNRTSNYHLFDLTRAQLSTKLSKKSGNYLGKLRAKNVNRTEYVLLNQNSEREEIAGVRFERVSLMNQLLQQENSQPRKMKIMVPPIDANGVPIPNRTADTDAGSLAEKLSEYETTALGHGSKDLHVFESKDPEFVNGNFRLNFHGRVSKPSVKNFQMVSRENVDDVICQFGKVDEDVFHLDFKAPINACQAFAFALCQFNL